MAMNLSNIDGIIGKSLQFGTDLKRPFLLETREDGTFGFSHPFDNQHRNIRTSHVAEEDSDVVNLKVLNNTKTDLFDQLTTYTDTKVAEALGSEDDPMSEGNLMMKPKVITCLYDMLKTRMGFLNPTKFMYSLILEIREPFPDWNDGEYMFQVALGDGENPQRFVPWTRVTGIENTMEIKICETLTDFTKVYLYAILNQAPSLGLPEQPEFKQRFINDHDHDKITSWMRADADWHIVSFYVQSYDLTGQRIVDYQTWYPDYYDSLELFDFAFNMPLNLDYVGHEYEILEINPALQYVKAFHGYEESEIYEEDGLWKRKYRIRTQDSWEWIHHFLMGRAKQENEWIHVYLFDMDAINPEVPVMIYHIWNDIMTPDPKPLDENTQFLFTTDPFRLAVDGTSLFSPYDRLVVDKADHGTTIAYSGAVAAIDALFDNINIPNDQKVGTDLIEFDFLSKKEGYAFETMDEDGTRYLRLEGYVADQNLAMQASYPGLQGIYTSLKVTFKECLGNMKLIIFNPAYDWFYHHTNHNGLFGRLLLTDDRGESHYVYYTNQEGYFRTRADFSIDIPVGVQTDDYDIQIILYRGDNIADTEFITVVNNLVFLNQDQLTNVHVDTQVEHTAIQYVKSPTASATTGLKPIVKVLDIIDEDLDDDLDDDIPDDREENPDPIPTPKDPSEIPDPPEKPDPEIDEDLDDDLDDPDDGDQEEDDEDDPEPPPTPPVEDEDDDRIPEFEEGEAHVEGILIARVISF